MPENNEDSNECRPIVSLQQSESKVQIDSRWSTHEVVDRIIRSSCFSSEVIGSASTSRSAIENEKPYPPQASDLPKQYLPLRTLSFQDCWFSAYPWLHWDMEKCKLLCFYSKNLYNEKMSFGGKKIEPTFTRSSFTNWKKGIRKFQIHQSSDMLCTAIEAFLKKQDKSACKITYLSKQVEI